MEDFQSQAVSLLDDVGLHIIDKIPGMAVLTGVSLFASTVGDDLRHNYMLHYWLTFTAGFGGGFSSALVLMRPDIVPLNFFTGYTDTVFTLCWWLMNYFPYNIPGRIVRTPFITEITKLLLMVAVGRVMTNRLDVALHLHPHATMGAIIIGSMGGCGGKIINDIIRGGYHMATDSDEMRVPGISANRAVCCCVVYYALVHMYNILKPHQGTTLVILMLENHASLYGSQVLCSWLRTVKQTRTQPAEVLAPVLSTASSSIQRQRWAHTLVLDLTGFNPLTPLVSLFHTVFNIPQPLPPSRAPIKPVKPVSSANISENKKTS